MSRKKTAPSADGRTETEDRIITLICNLMAVDESEITPKTELQADLGADSLDGVELAMLIEEEFGIQFNDDEIETMLTFENIVGLVTKKCGESSYAELSI